MAGSLLDANQTLKNAFVDSKSAFQMLPITSMINGAFDYASLAQTSTVDTWTFKSGGSGGTTVCTIAITYTDSTKATISSVART